MPFPQRVIPSRSDIPDVYQGNNQNVLQKAAVNNMIGVLDQLNKISVFANEIFTDILATTEKNSSRIKTVKTRLSSIESRLQPVESMFVTKSPSYFYDNPFPGKEWQRKDPLRGLLFRRDRANKAVNLRRSVGLPLPDLSSLDAISPHGQCIKKYSDSNFFMNEWLEAEKKKMEEEKAKRRERKRKKRSKRKRQQQEKITGIERWVYDPITGKKVKKKAAEITVTKYELTDTNITGNIDFESADAGHRSKIAMMANKKGSKKKKKQMQQQQPAKQKHQPAVDDYKQKSRVPISPNNANKPPPVPFAAPGGRGGGGGGPPPVPVVAAAGAEQGPPPVPFAAVGGGGPPPVPGGRGGARAGEGPPVIPGGGGGGGPPPVPGGRRGPPVNPVVEKKKLSGAEMAALSASRAKASGAYERKKEPEPPKPAPLVPVSSNALLAGIRGGVKLKKTTQVKREPKMDKRDVLLSALRGKGQSGLKKVVVEPKKEREKEVDNTIFAILNRRQYMADDSDTESGSSWDSESD